MHVKQVDIDKMINMKKEGLTQKEIADLTEYSFAMIAKYCKGIKSEKIIICKKKDCNNIVLSRKGRQGRRKEYCSDYCRHIDSKRKQCTMLCTFCHKSFMTKSKKQIYCNQECRGKSKQTNINRLLQCVVCNNDFIPKNKTQKCCGPDCAIIERTKTKYKKGIFGHGLWHLSREERNARKRELNKTDICLNLNNRMRCGMNQSLRNGMNDKNGAKWETLVKYTVSDLKEHLERLFVKGMNWINIGEWHIDHIRPISWFNFQSHEDIEFQECWALNNLQPLWAKDNFSKRNRYEG